MQLAALTRCPEFEIEKEEAAKLAGAAADVASHYDIAITPKQAAWTKLYGALGVIYGTRLYAIRARKKMEKAERNPATPKASQDEPANGEGKVVHLRPGDFDGPGANLDHTNPGG